jgi:uncharacterized membrane protein YqhA
MLRKIETAVEWALWQSRLMVFFAVVASLVSALLLILLGTWDVVLLSGDFLCAFSSQEAYEAFHKQAITGVVGAVDSYLIATVLLIFGLGLYELFISKIDLAEKDSLSSRVLVIHTLDQLKEKLAKVIVMVLIVIFFKNAVNVHYDGIGSLIYLAGGILLIAAALWFMGKGHAPEKETDKE